MTIETKLQRALPHAPKAVTFAAGISAVLLTFTAMAQTPSADPPSPSAAPSQPPSAAPNSSPNGPPSTAGAFGNWVQQGGTWVQQGGQWVQQGGAWVQQGGQWMQQSVTGMGAGVNQVVGTIGGQAGQATQNAADAARDAAASVTRLPNTTIAGGHERCVIAPNGAPDCRNAAETLCRTKGFAKGTSVDLVTVENCPPPYRTSRRDAPEGVCTMEHFVTKALCQ
jgi:hypothetical protein